MALHKKHRELLSFDAEIMVVQECSRRCVTQISRAERWASAWFGKNPHKGLAVLVKPPWTIRESRPLKPKWSAKLVIDGPNSFDLYPVWACKGDRPGSDYIGQIHLLLDLIEKSPPSRATIVVGDFNSNSIWDHEHEINSHSDAVARFRELGFQSAYHNFFGHKHGEERHPTLWFRKKKTSTYHIDYAFLSRELQAKLKRVVVGHSKRWLPHSDHAPILLELDL